MCDADHYAAREYPRTEGSGYANAMSAPRIIAGKAGGLRLKSIPGDSTRPITDKVKEALFNILGSDILGADFLDIFGGTGSVGIEALSRGARFARFIEINRTAAGVLRANLQYTRLDQYAEVLQADAFSVLRRPPDRSFDYIFIAPPQYKGMWLEALQILDQNPGWMVDNAWLIVQIHPVEYQAVSFRHFVEFERRDYGSTLLVFYERTAPDS